MELITILNRCHRFRGFVYQHAHFGADKKSIEVAVRPRKGFDRSLLTLPSAGARLRSALRAPFRVHSFLDFWFFCCTPCGASIPADARRSWSRKCRGAMESV